VHTRYPFAAASLSEAPRRRHAVVVGGSLAGMLAARVLADHFDVITLLERHYFSETPAARKGLAQGRHMHVLLERGRGVLQRFFSGRSVVPGRIEPTAPGSQSALIAGRDQGSQGGP
jgi:2-polyprenyl-6-methoxyphenol hydroxylase-like FAD-dependent oxidoreductase